MWTRRKKCGCDNELNWGNTKELSLEVLQLRWNMFSQRGKLGESGFLLGSVGFWHCATLLCYLENENAKNGPYNAPGTFDMH